MPDSFSAGVVLTTCTGREENLTRTLKCLSNVDYFLEGVVIIYDGCQPTTEHIEVANSLVGEVTAVAIQATIEKHHPGQEQPRNVGARWLSEVAPTANYVWFLDSDLVFEPTILDAFAQAHLYGMAAPRILIGPYDWLSRGQTAPQPGLKNDGRWVSFDEHGPEKTLVHDLGAGLACFGGNLVWPLDEFERVGGFHPDLHHGRCEDGELGLRAASLGVPMAFVRSARAYHVWHPRDEGAILAKNERDVPLLNAWHPWVQEKGLILTAKDGARFDFKCPECQTQVNSCDYWNHMSEHLTGEPANYQDPASVIYAQEEE